MEYVLLSDNDMALLQSEVFSFPNGSHTKRLINIYGSLDILGQAVVATNAYNGMGGDIGDKKYRSYSSDDYGCAGGGDDQFEDFCNKFGTHWDWDGTVHYRDDNCGIWDSRWGQCELKRATGSKNLCCLYGKSGNTYDACPSTYTDNRYSSSSCRTPWRDLCDQSNMLIDWRCKEYYKQNPDDTYVIQETGALCNKNVSQDGCKDFCLANPGKCDSGAANYCRNSNDVFCACINSPASDYNNVNPVCIDADCRNNATYRTAAMSQITECTSVNCNIIQNLAAGGKMTFTNNEMVQNCNASSGPDPVDPNPVDPNPVDPVDPVNPDPTNPTTPTNSTNSTNPTTDSTNIILYSSIGALIFIFIIIIVISMSGKSGKSRRRKMKKFINRRRR